MLNQEIISRKKSCIKCFLLCTKVNNSGTIVGRSAFAINADKINKLGVRIYAGRDLALAAGHDLRIQSAQNSSSTSLHSEQQQSGLFASSSGITLGSQASQHTNSSTTLSQQASTVGSTGGTVTLSAGNQYTQSASHVLAAGTGDVQILAKNVTLSAASDTMQASQSSHSQQSGLSLSISNPVLSAANSVQQMGQAASQVSDPRLQALAAASATLAVKQAASSVANNPGSAGGIQIGISLGSSQSSSQSQQSSQQAAASTVQAGGNVVIVASADPAKKDGNIAISGSHLSAGGHAALIADGDITLQSAQNSSQQSSSNHSSSASLGVGLGIGGTNSGFTVTANASQGKGQGNGSDISHSNSSISAGKQLLISSGGDTTLAGAVASAERISAEIGGNLHIASQQDTSDYNSTQHSAGIGIAIPIGAGTGSVSGHLSNSKVDSQYASVGQQSGMLAGDGGFTVQVGGKTELTGAVIASTAQALEQGLNSFNSANGLVMNDMQNQAAFSAHSMSASGGVGTLPAGNQGTALGLGLAGGNAQSVSLSGISGIAGNTSITSDAAQTGIAAIFNAQQVQQTINAQTQITAAASQQAPQAVASYAESQQTALREQAKNENDPIKRAELQSEADKWNEGGVNRAKLHLVTGALSGGIGGALGAGAAALAAPMLEQVQSSMAEQLTGAGLAPGLANMAAQAIATGAAAGIGGAAGGGMAGASMGLVVDANNRQLHPTEIAIIKKNAARFAKKLYNTDDPMPGQVEGALALLANTAQTLVDNNLGYTVPYSAQAEAFLHTLQTEYAGTTPNVSIGGGQFLFHATPEQINSPHINSDSVDKEIAGIIIKNPIKSPSSVENTNEKRDPATNLVLDEKGRYSQRITVDGKPFEPKYFPCPVASAGCSGQNLDMADAQTAAYVKALDKKVLNDIGTASTLVTIANPVGVAGVVAGTVGTLSSLADGILNDEFGSALTKEILAASATKYLKAVYGLSEAVSNRITAVVDLSGGWQAFIDRAKETKVPDNSGGR
ncbi:hemagglutinin repeat-containing protein [Undibacterium sp. CCC1.1]|uniref:hemagglutinin repeat-containing protein n=1 Tax=Undibacterium sp. CCC1.1 TaxID=3048602 RepID=UPI002B23AEDB|nr:hemagglutinin repeat-containing protein [Undibacterium sp. CCC1.1]MEB0171151.1 hemagglutinin repeat-containing protein [Undibacterium sp. CCC1.1]